MTEAPAAATARSAKVMFLSAAGSGGAGDGGDSAAAWCMTACSRGGAWREAGP